MCRGLERKETPVKHVIGWTGDRLGVRRRLEEKRPAEESAHRVTDTVGPFTSPVLLHWETLSHLGYSQVMINSLLSGPDPCIPASLHDFHKNDEPNVDFAWPTFRLPTLFPALIVQ